MSDYERTVTIVDEDALRRGVVRARGRKRDLTRYSCANCATATSLCSSCEQERRELDWINLVLALDKARSAS